jgi:hypothetical protein
MESHALHGLGVWYESDDTVWVNLFAPSTAECTVGDARLTMESDFPDGETATIGVRVPRAKEFTLAIRRPVWAGDGFRVAVNGTALEQPALASLHDPVAGGRAGGPGNEAESQSGSYVRITRTWRSGDTVSLVLPKSLHLEPTADDASVTAIMWGPLALAADHGPRREERRGASPAPIVPVLVSESSDPREFVQPAGRAGDFRAHRVARKLTGDPGDASPAGDLVLTPFYRTHRRNYSLYFDLLTPAGFSERGAALVAARETAARLDAATVGRVQPGDPQSEREHDYRSEPSDRAAGRTNGRTSRAGTGWFSFDIPVDASAPMALIVTYFNDPGLPAPVGDFAILVDGVNAAHYTPDQAASGFHQVEYVVPAALTQGKEKVTVRFESGAGGRIVPVFGIRTVRR